jgi:hypothetical protein
VNIYVTCGTDGRGARIGVCETGKSGLDFIGANWRVTLNRAYRKFESRAELRILFVHRFAMTLNFALRIAEYLSLLIYSLERVEHPEVA